MSIKFNYMFKTKDDITDCLNHMLEQSKTKDGMKVIFNNNNPNTEDYLKDFFAINFVSIKDINKCSELIHNMVKYGHNCINVDIVLKRRIIYQYGRMLIKEKNND